MTDEAVFPDPHVASPDRHLGRATEATVSHWGNIVGMMPVAPKLFHGPLPRKSAKLWMFRNPRKRAQEIGNCTGESGAASGETNVNIRLGKTWGKDAPQAFVPPGGFSPEMLAALALADANGYISLSSLWVYNRSRLYSKAHGVWLGGEGAIVSHALLAMKESGYLPYELYPSTSQNYRSYSDRERIPQEWTDQAKLHLVKDGAILQSPDQILESLAANRTVWIGTDIPQGFMHTDDKGFFNMSGRTVGGHAREVLAYDQDEGWVCEGNSWPQWGMRSDDPAWAPLGGYTNIGFCHFDEWMRQFEGGRMSNGSSEAVVVNVIGDEGWGPRSLEDQLADLYG